MSCLLRIAPGALRHVAELIDKMFIAGRMRLAWSVFGPSRFRSGSYQSWPALPNGIMGLAADSLILMHFFSDMKARMTVIYDESNNITLSSTPPTPAKTTWTLLIYLTGPATGCAGGETVFYPELGPAKKFSGKASDRTDPVVVDLEVGMALLHKHGQDCLLHEGKTVRKGEKWVIRSDLCVKR